MNKKNQNSIAKNTMFMYIRMIFLIIISLYTSRLVLNTLGVVDYGIYNVVGGIVILFGFLNGALSHATQRFIAFEQGRDNKEDLSKTFSMCLNVHIVIAIVVVLLSETFGLWVLNTQLQIPQERFHTALVVYQIWVTSKSPCLNY